MKRILIGAGVTVVAIEIILSIILTFVFGIDLADATQ